MFEMKTTAQRLATAGRIILDASQNADESSRQLVEAGVAAAEEGRNAWRRVLCTAQGLGKFCNGIVLNEEGFGLAVSDKHALLGILREQGMVVGVRVDTGLFPLNGYGEKGTDGLVTLAERCPGYYAGGARFAKWRTIVRCTLELPTDAAVWENMSRLAECARICQKHGLVLAAELDISVDGGNHSAERTAYVSEKIYSHAIRQMNERDVNLEAVLLLPSVCRAGSESGPARLEDVATLTARSLRRTVPPAVAGIHPCGLDDLSLQEAARNYRAVQEAMAGAPWPVVPMYGPSLLAPVLATWAKGGDVGNAQAYLLRLLEAIAGTQLGADDRAD